MHVFELSKKHVELACEEILSLTEAPHQLIGNFLLTDAPKELYKRLGLCHRIYKLLFTSSLQKINEDIQAFDWNAVYEGDLCVRVHSHVLNEKEIANDIYKRIDNPTVNLQNPSTKIVLFHRHNTVIVTKFIHNVDKSYLKRKAHLRPALHPTSMDPGLARAAINLTGLTNGTLLDPFCGSGGILIEAGLMGFDCVGLDIDEKQIKRAQKNLSHYLLSFTLHNMDALAYHKNADAIVTDLPYGKSSTLDNMDIYCTFFKHAYSLTKKMVVVVPHFYQKDIPLWKVQNTFEIYMHKSLTRVLLQLSH